MPVLLKRNLLRHTQHFQISLITKKKKKNRASMEEIKFFRMQAALPIFIMALYVISKFCNSKREMCNCLGKGVPLQNLNQIASKYECIMM